MAWLYLLVAGLLEIAWATGFKYARGLEWALLLGNGLALLALPFFGEPGGLWVRLATLAAMSASLVLLSVSLKSLPMGTAYAVWTGIGAAGTALVGMVWLGESAHPLRLLFLAMIVVGLVGLKWVSADA